MVAQIFVRGNEHVDGDIDINAFFVKSAAGFQKVAKRISNKVLAKVCKQSLLIGMEYFCFFRFTRTNLANVIDTLNEFAFSCKERSKTGKVKQE